MTAEQNTSVETNPGQLWKEEIALAERALRKFHERARIVEKRYVDERDSLNSNQKWFNIFYSNTVILESSLYSQLPKPLVSRRFKDFDDEVGRVASVILQRCITQDLDNPQDTFDATMKHCVQDRLVPGLGQAWLRLETTTEEIEKVLPDANESSEAESDDYESSDTEPMQRITHQRVVVDYVFWSDFLWSPCRVWEERRWVGRKVYMDRDELIDRFGKELGECIPLDYVPKRVGDNSGEGSVPEEAAGRKAVIYEIWVRKGRKVVWVSKGMPDILDEESDPLELTDFEPCPKPMLANVSTSNSVPRPDYYMIQDQYSELDTVNHRISKLVQACKVVGVYDKGAMGIARMLKEGFDNELIPVDNWAMFAEKGGIKGQIDWLPLEEVVTAINQLNIAREAIKQQIYELTGIADIVRGATKASETLGAQEIKAKFASVRIKKLQDEVARFASDIMRIKAEIMVRHFEPQFLVLNSNIESTPDAPLAGQAIALLKSDVGFEWRVEVSADSIAQADYDLEKQDRIDFLGAVSSYLEKAGAMFQVVPQSATLLVGILKWAVAGFKNVNEIEGMIDKALDDLTKNPPQNKPDPEQLKQQMEQQKQQSDAAIKQQQAQTEFQIKQMEFQMEQQRLQMEFKMEQQRLAAELAQERALFELDQQKALLEISMMREKMAMEKLSMHQKVVNDMQMNQVKLETAQATADQSLQHSQAQADQQLDTQRKLGEAQVAQANKPQPKKSNE